MKINYVPDIQHIIRKGPVVIYKCVDSACPLFLVSRYLSARKMFVCYIKITTCTFQTKPCETKPYVDIPLYHMCCY